jgi:hypothetical protein
MFVRNPPGEFFNDLTSALNFQLRYVETFFRFSPTNLMPRGPFG